MLFNLILLVNYFYPVLSIEFFHFLLSFTSTVFSRYTQLFFNLCINLNFVFGIVIVSFINFFSIFSISAETIAVISSFEFQILHRLRIFLEPYSLKLSFLQINYNLSLYTFQSLGNLVFVVIHRNVLIIVLNLSAIY